MELRAPRAAALAAAALAALLALAAPAWGSDHLRFPPSETEPPPGHRLSAAQVIEIAGREPKVEAERRERGELRAYAYLKDDGDWQVSYFEGGTERAQVTVDDPSGAVLEAWTGPQVAWKMARGYENAFAGKVNAPYVWIPLCLLFLAPFVDPRRPFRLLHLDLAVLLAFGASHFFFNRGEISASVPLAYPVLLYLFVRLLWTGVRPRPARGPLLPWAPATWLALALVALVGFRVTLNVTDGNVIDVGYAGVIGADRISDGRELYADFPEDNHRGDTYGAANYLLYVPFEAVLPFKGDWDSLPAAHATAIFLDLVTLLGLLVLGRRLRAGPAGRALGVALAYAWAAYPYTLYAMNSSTNDTLIAAVLVWALVALRSPPLRGALVGFGAAAKFAPLALAPLFATADDGRRMRGAIVFSLTLAVVIAATFAPFLPDGGVREIWDRTLGYQLERDSPFSIWGQTSGFDAVWTALKIGAAGLALLVAFVPRRKTAVQVAALGAAVLVALQIAAAHWFYLYIVWFAPFALVAFMCRHDPYARPPASDADPNAAERPAALAAA